MGHYFELLATRQYDIGIEVMKLHTLFSSEKVSFGPGYSSQTIHEYINKNIFRRWKYCDTFLSLDDLLSTFSVKLYSGISLEKYLLYAEVIYNLCALFYKKFMVTSMAGARDQIAIIFQNIEIVIGNFNYEIHDDEDDEDKYIIVEKDASATRAADIVDIQSAKRIYEYNHFLLRGNVAKKAEILAQLAKTIEQYRSDLESAGYKNIYSDTTCLLNNLNIRHAATSGKAKTFLDSLTPTQLEDLYDDAYDLILTCIVLYNSIAKRKKVDAIKQQLV